MPLLQVRPSSQRGGVLFAITDARQKVVELGLALTPVSEGLQNILLYYTDREHASHSYKAAAFSVPDMTGQWTRFTVSITDAGLLIQLVYANTCKSTTKTHLTHVDVLIIWLQEILFNCTGTYIKSNPWLTKRYRREKAFYSAWQVVVEHDEVRLYMDCGEPERVTLHRGAERLTFSHNSGIFVANAGSTGLDKFVVSE